MRTTSEAQEKAVAVKRVVNVLWRCTHLSRREPDGRARISKGELMTAYSSTYPSASEQDLQSGLSELVEMGEVEIIAEDVLFDLSKLPWRGIYLCGKTENGGTVRLNKDEQWLLDLFAVARRHSLSPKQIVNLWESIFPGRKLSYLRDAVKGLKQRQLVETTDRGILIFIGEAAKPGTGTEHSRDAGSDAL
jgi:hypothetical protein